VTVEDKFSIAAPTLPKGGGAIQSIGKGWGAVGTTGAASFTLALPISPGRGYAPGLALSYSSAAGKSEFGQGWSMPRPAIARRAGKGVPAYAEDDEFVSPSADVLMPEVDATGTPVLRTAAILRGVALGETYTVQRYFPRVRGDGARWESWRGDDDWFWLVHDANGSLHVYGKTVRVSQARTETSPERIAEWLLEESVAPDGEHILYEYLAEDDEGLSAADTLRDCTRRRYLWRVRYGNTHADPFPFLLRSEAVSNTWHFDLIFDYDQRDTGYGETPTYAASHPWSKRPDPYSSFAYGFELRTLRLCRQVLMFHTFAPTQAERRAGEEEHPLVTRSLGEAPVLVKRLLLEYDCDALSSSLVAAHSMGYGAEGEIVHLPPVEFRHIPFPAPQDARFTPFAALANSPGIQSERAVREPYQWVDLYGEGLPGVLARDERGWWYREPLRADADVDAHADPDAVAYGAPTLLEHIPTANATATSTRQWLADLTGDGKLEWIVARPGIAGFFALNPDRRWSSFVTFGAFPLEFFSPQGQLADLMGDGLSDLAMIGTRSVRLYANRREAGFAPARDVAHDEDALPGLGDGRCALVAFSDVLGSGQQHLIEIRHDRISVWPNLGRGRFGKRLAFAALSFDASEFDASRIRLADLDGSGATDLIYLRSDRIQVLMNQSGNGFATAVDVPWPDGVRYDRLCEVSAADLQGLGCASLVLTVPYMTPQHWRCDFVSGVKPYLIEASDNNMGAGSEIIYRSSAQEWLDEKQHKLAARQPAVSQLPFPVHVTSVQRQLDQVSGNTLSQHFAYREGYYDGIEREFRGFGLLLKTDTETARLPEDGASAPVLTKTWFHVGAALNPPRAGFDDRDEQAIQLGATLCSDFQASTEEDTLVTGWEQGTLLDAARTLSGMVRRVEVFGLEDNAPDMPFNTAETRYLVRRYEARALHRCYSQMQPFVLETINYQYERDFGDPRCQQVIGLRWDRHGGAIHGAVIHHARRGSATPPFSPEMPDYAHHLRWWEDAHDDQQGSYYLTETKSESIHLEGTDYWRLHFPYMSRERAGEIRASDLPMSKLNYEAFRAAGSPLENAGFVLAGQSLQRYKDKPCGQANFQGLADYCQTAVLDDMDLAVYADVMLPEVLEARLIEAGYHRMPLLDPSPLITQAANEPSTVDPVMWSIHAGFATHAGLEGFYKVILFQPTRSIGLTTVTYDPYWLFPVMVRGPDQCTSLAEYDYLSLQPVLIRDANHNVSEARYDALGRLLAMSFHGTEHGGQPVGFAPLSDYVRAFDTPDEAIAAPEAALCDAAGAYFVDAFAWMGRASEALRQAVHAAGEARLLLPAGHLRASARWRLARDGGSVLSDSLRQQLLALPREPVHGAALVADQYTVAATPPTQADSPRAQPDKQIRIGIDTYDGFGRLLQRKQKVPPGNAYKTIDGVLELDGNGKPVEVQAQTRWRVSEPVEYNNKGLPVRVYRPYFADTHRTIRDEGFRQAMYFDRQYYDALGRPTVSLTVSTNGAGEAIYRMRRETYYPWHIVSEDENDTAEEMKLKRREQTVTSR
jgi:hypothetical protein